MTGGGRAVDLAAPGAIPVAELVPGLARTLGLLDPSTVFGGFRLVRSDGGVLDSDRSLQAQGVEDGTVLTLEAGIAIPDVRVYDDVVEAVTDAVEGQYAAWTPRDSALTAVFASAAFLLAGAVLLLGADRADVHRPASRVETGPAFGWSATVAGARGRRRDARGAARTDAARSSRSAVICSWSSVSLCWSAPTTAWTACARTGKP